ncbi:MAG: hypothetical protein E2O79_05730 [Caldithrix sp.]|nr:substrate-binding domain-containing protein [candidate division KSB1 bacterium]TDI83011.1 MAG: hypothetical protein E2O79_05730 [Caldithrix sp.]
MTSILLALLFIQLTLAIGPAAGQVAIIVNKEAAVRDITKDELKSVYFGELQQWKDGDEIVLTDRKDNDVIAMKFYDDFLGRNQRKVRKLWLRKVLRGEIRPPESFNTDGGIIKFVAENKEAIGFVSAASVKNSVRVLSVNGKNPGNRAYELK